RGGIARSSREHDLLPRSGAFAGKEARLPYDYDELIAAIAPRPVYVLSPQFDRDATPADVKKAVEQARKVYGLYKAPDNLMLDEPWDYNRLPLATQDRAIHWMKEKMRWASGHTLDTKQKMTMRTRSSSIIHAAFGN